MLAKIYSKKIITKRKKVDVIILIKKKMDFSHLKGEVHYIMTRKIIRHNSEPK